MKKIVHVIVSIMVISLIFGCGMSTEDIGEIVKTSMQETLSTDSNFREYNLQVDNVQVIKKSKNNYKGLAKIIYKGSSYNVNVDIFVDGGDVMWEAAHGSFMFIAQEELKNFFQ